ncbi:MAG: hypothetical protein Q8P67_17550 [archaeon]|nr:hypothetical protein [archaeon]
MADPMLHLKVMVRDESNNVLTTILKDVQPRRTLTVDGLKLLLIKDLVVGSVLTGAAASLVYTLSLIDDHATAPLDTVSFRPFLSAHPAIPQLDPVPLVLTPVAAASARPIGVRSGPSQSNLPRFAGPGQVSVPYRTISSSSIARIPKSKSPSAIPPTSSPAPHAPRPSPLSYTAPEVAPSSSISPRLRPRASSRKGVHDSSGTGPEGQASPPSKRRHRRNTLGIASMTNPSISPSPNSPLVSPESKLRPRASKASSPLAIAQQDRTRILSSLRLARLALSRFVDQLRASAEPPSQQAARKVFEAAMELVDDAMATPNLSPLELSCFEPVQAKRDRVTELFLAQSLTPLPAASPPLAADSLLAVRLGSLINALRAALSSSGFRRFVPPLKALPDLASYPTPAIVLLQRAVRRWLFRHRFMMMFHRYARSSDSRSIRTRNRLIEEILSSEASYNSSLRECLELYHRPLTRLVGQPDTVISSSEIEAIFLNLQSIHAISSRFLDQLTTRHAQWPAVQTFADLFLAQGLLEDVTREYASYTLNYGHAIQALEALCTERPRLKQFFASQSQLSASSHSNPVTFLIMPIQRLPRYRMLLVELLKHTEETHVDFHNIHSALDQVARATMSINHSKKQHEDIIKAKADLQNLARHLSDPLEALPSGQPRELHAIYDLVAHPTDRASEPVRIYLFSDFLIESIPAEPNNFSSSSAPDPLLHHRDIPQLIKGIYRHQDFTFKVFDQPQPDLLVLAILPKNISTGMCFRALSGFSAESAAEIKRLIASVSPVDLPVPLPSATSLTLEVLYAKNLPVADLNGYSDPFVVVKYAGAKHRTPTIWKNLNPVWNAQPFHITLDPRYPNLALSVWDEDMVGKDFLGSIDIPWGYLASLEDSVLLQTFILHDTSFHVTCGIITLRFTVLSRTDFKSPQ